VTTTPQIIVVTDANVLINLMHVARLDICARLLGYATEFDFKWNHRAKLWYTDLDRTTAALKGITGKRLMYRDSDPH
jgi:hypothetical protein